MQIIIQSCVFVCFKTCLLGILKFQDNLSSFATVELFLVKCGQSTETQTSEYAVGHSSPLQSYFVILSKTNDLYTEILPHVAWQPVQWKSLKVSPESGLYWRPSNRP